MYVCISGVATAKACALATLLTIKLAVYSEFMLCAYSLPFYSGVIIQSSGGQISTVAVVLL